LFDAIIELHVVDEEIFYDFLVGKGKWKSHVIKVYLNHGLYPVYVAESFITLIWKT
jgi:hypothetical protein